MAAKPGKKKSHALLMAFLIAAGGYAGSLYLVIRDALDDNEKMRLLEIQQPAFERIAPVLDSDAFLDWVAACRASGRETTHLEHKEADSIRTWFAFPENDNPAMELTSFSAHMYGADETILFLYFVVDGDLKISLSFFCPGERFDDYFIAKTKRLTYDRPEIFFFNRQGVSKHNNWGPDLHVMVGHVEPRKWLYMTRPRHD